MCPEALCAGLPFPDGRVNLNLNAVASGYINSGFAISSFLLNEKALYTPLDIFSALTMVGVLKGCHNRGGNNHCHKRKANQEINHGTLQAARPTLLSHIAIFTRVALPRAPQYSAKVGAGLQLW